MGRPVFLIRVCECVCVCMRVCVYCCAAHGQDWRVREPGIAALLPLRGLIQDYGQGEGKRLLLTPGLIMLGF